MTLSRNSGEQGSTILRDPWSQGLRTIGHTTFLITCSLRRGLTSGAVPVDWLHSWQLPDACLTIKAEGELSSFSSSAKAPRRGFCWAQLEYMSSLWPQKWVLWLKKVELFNKGGLLFWPENSQQSLRANLDPTNCMSPKMPSLALKHFLLVHPQK